MKKKLRQVFMPGTGQIIEKKSRFIGDVFQVNSDTEAQEYVAGIKKKYYDARHHCFAYVLGDPSIVRASDDGEPSGTAGKPILDVLMGEGLLNTMIVVTRYFGGTLLGTGGLTRAYKEAAKAAVEASVFIERYRGAVFKVTIGYDLLGKLENFINEMPYIYETDSQYGENVMKTFVVESDYKESVEKKIIEFTSNNAYIDIGIDLDYGIVDNRVIWL